jgi:hypothetical protein
VSAETSRAGVVCERTKPRTARPSAAATRAVSAQWLIAPRRFAATMRRQPETHREVGTSSARDRHEEPARAPTRYAAGGGAARRGRRDHRPDRHAPSRAATGARGRGSVRADSTRRRIARRGAAGVLGSRRRPSRPASAPRRVGRGRGAPRRGRTRRTSSRRPCRCR